MKNLINFKTILVHSIWIAGTLILVSSCFDNKTTDSKKIAEQENIDKLTTDDRIITVVKNDNDAEFLMEVAEMQMEEISLGKLAQQKGNAAHVKELGKMMESDHTKTHNELKALAQSKSVYIPTSQTDDSRDAYAKLADKTGNDFGKTYSAMVVENHEDAIDLFERASTESEDPEIRAWASANLAPLRTHLKHAEACKKECDKMK